MEENSRCGELTILLDQLEDLIEEGKTGFLSSRISIDREQMKSVIEEIRLKLPTEVTQSVWIVEERNKILAEAQQEAHLVIEEAHEKIQEMVDQNQITRYATERAENIVEEAKQDAREIRLGAAEYAEEVFKNVELSLKKSRDIVHNEMQNFEAYVSDVLREIYDNRQEIKEMGIQITNPEE